VKVHISVDMEGISGVADAADTMLGAPHYEYCRRLTTAECNAAIAGCFEAGTTDVLVNDSHGTMLNLLQEQLDPRVRVIRGRPKSLGMMQGIDDKTQATMFVGYHAALCENLPGIKRVASRDIEYTSNNYPEIYRLLRVLLALAASVAALPYSYD
jgi:D-amino peptidase